MNRIVVVCRQNAARSVLVTAALRILFPQYDVISCGMEATTGAPYPEITLKTAKDLGLTLEGLHSLNICDVAGGLSIEDRILVSDGFMKDSHLFSTLHSSNIYSFEQFAPVDTFIPLDPIGLNLSDFKKEIAKAIFCATKAVSSFPESQSCKSNIEILTADELNEETISKTVEYCRETSSDLLIANFEIPPTLSLEIEGTEAKFLEFTSLSSYQITTWQKSIDSSNVSIIQSEHEMNFPPRDILSIHFRDSLKKMSQEKPIVVLCEFSNSSSRILVNQILMASAMVPFSRELERANESSSWIL